MFQQLIDHERSLGNTTLQYSFGYDIEENDEQIYDIRDHISYVHAISTVTQLRNHGYKVQLCDESDGDYDEWSHAIIWRSELIMHVFWNS